MDEGAVEDMGRELLAAALDELVAATSALVVVLREAGGARERHIAAQLAVTLATLAATRGQLGRGDVWHREADLEPGVAPPRHRHRS